MTSKTTQNVAAGGVVSAAAIVGMLQAVRSVWPSALQWESGEDLVVAGAVAALINIVVAPVVSRYLAFWRDPDKADSAALRKSLMCVALCAGLVMGSGCATVGTSFKETIVEADGSSAETVYKARSLAPPLGKLETTNHQWNYRWGGEENQIATGQDAQGLDNTGQSVLIPLIQTFMNALADAYKASVAVPPVVPEAGPDIVLSPFP
jgi:hypothetical protein